jgi:hypothetical protein
MKRVFLLLLIALAAPDSAWAQAQRACPAHCRDCAHHQALARYYAGDARMVRLRNETVRRGGSREAAVSLTHTRDFQSVLRNVQRACGCPSWC